MTDISERTNAGRMHVLRHSFEPNEPLSHLLSEFTGPDTGSPFLLRSTKEVYVDSVNYSRGSLREEDEYVHAIAERAKRTYFTIGNAALRPLHVHERESTKYNTVTSGYRIALMPLQSDIFNMLAKSLDTYPQVAPPRSTLRSHYLYINVDSPPQSSHEVADAEAMLKARIAEGLPKQLYAARMLGVRAMEASSTHRRS